MVDIASVGIPSRHGLPGSDGTAGALVYTGQWDASAGQPPSTAPQQGQYWEVRVAGTTVLGGIAEWRVQDWAVWNGVAWEKVDNQSSAAPLCDTFNDFFQAPGFLQRGGGFWDVSVRGGAFNRLGGKVAVAQGDYVGYMPNLAPDAMGGPALPLTLQAIDPSATSSSGSSTTVSSSTSTSASGVTHPPPAPVPFLPGYRRDVQYIPDMSQPGIRTAFPNVPMLFASQDWFDALSADMTAQNQTASSALLAQMGLMAATPGVSMNQAPGLTWAIVGAMSMAEFADAEHQPVSGSSSSFLPLTPGVVVFTVDYAAAVTAAANPGTPAVTPPMRAWLNGLAMPASSLAMVSSSTSFSPDTLLSQFLLGTGQFTLMAGTPCVAMQKMLVISRPVTDAEALDISRRMQAGMEHPV